MSVKSWETLSVEQVCGLVPSYCCTQWPTGKFGCFSGMGDGSSSCSMPSGFSTGPVLTMSSKRVWGEGCNYSCCNEMWDPLFWGVTRFVTHRNPVWSVGAFVLVLNLCVSTWRGIALSFCRTLRPHFRNGELKPCLGYWWSPALEAKMYVVLHRFYIAPSQGKIVLTSVMCFDIGWETSQKHKAIISNLARRTWNKF